jgi:hypothetical protein
MQPGYWFSGPPSGGSQPYVFYTSSPRPPFDVVVGLDGVFVQPPQSSKLPSEAPFVVAAASGTLAYTITAGRSSSIWDFSPGQFDSDGLFRTALRQSFDKLLVDLDGLGLQPGRLNSIRGWIAQAVPQTFAESLYFRHGLDRVNRCAELTPGMRLRVDFEEHQAVDPGQDPRNGFVGTGTSYITVTEVAGHSGGLVLGFDPFISRLSGLSVAPATGGAGGAIDLQGAASQLPYWRLFYPPTYPSSDGTGVSGMQQSVVLIGAPNRADLETATTSYVGGQTLPGDVVSIWFRGRTTVVPEVPVMLQGQAAYVPLGTSVRDVLSAMTPLPRSTWNQVSHNVMTRANNLLPIPSSTLESGVQPDISQGWTPLGWDDVPLGSQAPWSPMLDTFDLPLLGGDSLWVPAPSPM